MQMVLFALLFSLLNSNLVGTAHSQALTVMENTVTSNNTIFISTPNAEVGIQQNTPKATLDVGGASTPGILVESGNIQLGNIVGSTVTVFNNGGNDFSLGMASASTVGGSGGSIFECGFHTGSPGRLACDLQRPSNFPFTAGAAEFTVTHTTTSATASEGTSITDQGFRNGFGIFQETSGGGPSTDITIAIADHNNLGNAHNNNGTDRSAIAITGYDSSSAGSFGSVRIGEFAQTNNEVSVDTRPYTALQVRTPDWPNTTVGTADSHNFALGGVAYDGANPRRIVWDQHVQVINSSGQSNYILRARNYTVSGGPDLIVGISTFVFVTDQGQLAIGSGASTPAATLDVQGNASFLVANTTFTVKSGQVGVNTASVAAGKVLEVNGKSLFDDTLTMGSGKNIVLSGGGTITGLTAPTTQVFTSGSGTYTTPAGVSWIKVTLVGAGGAGAGSGGAGVGTGTAGTDTTFGTSLLKGAGGAANNGGGGAGTGGYRNLSGGTGPPGQTAIGFGDAGFTGCSSPFGGAGVGSFSGNGGNAQANTGSGGAGGGGTPTVGAGASGACGGYVEAIITSPNSTYAYVVGAGGTGGAAGAGGSSGGNGGSGDIVVEEHYN